MPPSPGCGDLWRDDNGEVRGGSRGAVVSEPRRLTARPKPLPSCSSSIAPLRDEPFPLLPPERRQLVVVSLLLARGMKRVERTRRYRSARRGRAVPSPSVAERRQFVAGGAALLV